MNHNAIGTIAKQAIIQTLAINNETHGDAWVNRTDKEDIEHSVMHLLRYLVGDRSEPHIEHSITRNSFILARLELDRANATIACRDTTEGTGTEAGR